MTPHMLAGDQRTPSCCCWLLPVSAMRRRQAPARRDRRARRNRRCSPLHAVGAQIYECKPGADGKLAWTFRAPQATLIVDGKMVGQHYAGPTWELTDGSGITAKAVGNAPGATANDIPWLKLEVTSHKGSGLLADVTTVQRINTVGGMLKGACDRERAGRGMPYSADYVFLREGPDEASRPRRRAGYRPPSLRPRNRATPNACEF